METHIMDAKCAGQSNQSNHNSGRLLKSGWYWIHRFGAEVPEVCFWTGSQFLSIHNDASVLRSEDVRWHSDEPLDQPMDY